MITPCKTQLPGKGATGESDPAMPGILRKTVQQGNRSVIIETDYSVCGQGWLLRIIGRRGQTSEWMHVFDTAPEALIAGLAAIRYEGIEGFHDDPVFRHMEAAARLLQAD